MANRPSADQDAKASPRKPAAKKTARKSTARPARGASKDQSAKAHSAKAHSASQAPEKDGSTVLKEGVSRLFSRGRELLSEKGPGLLNSLERATVVAIDQTSKGITALEKGANELEAKVGQGLKDMLDRRRNVAHHDDNHKPRGPKA